MAIKDVDRNVMLDTIMTIMAIMMEPLFIIIWVRANVTNGEEVEMHVFAA